MKKTVLIFFIFLSISAFAQFSKTHYIPPLTAQNNLAEDQYIYISTPNLSNVNFKIIENGGNTITGVVNKNAPYTYYVGTGNSTQLLTPKTSIQKIINKGYIIEAEDLIYASVRLTSARTLSGTFNHAGGLVSKGNSALGKEFRLGAMLNPLLDATLLNFASILSTENGTRVTISNIPNGTLLSDGTIINGPITVTLNKNESYVLGFENTDNATPSNSSKMIGALVVSDKPVVVNAGSFCGSNSSQIGNLGGGITGPVGRDVGFDQIVPFEKTGKEYIFVKGNIASTTAEIERVLIVSHQPNTVVYINGITTPYATLMNAGDYIAIDGSNFINGNLFVSTSNKVFAYQSTSGTDSPANQNLFFVPPLNCSTPSIVDNIPLIESIGNTTYSGGLNIVTETGATVLINNSPITSGPVAIVGNPNYVRYTVTGLSGNITVKSTRQVYVSYYGVNGFATYGGYYSGFDTKPEIVTDKISVANSTCIPNVILKINTLLSYDAFQWYVDDVIIPGEISNTYRPTSPGFYQVKGSIANCPNSVPIFSDKIPVSYCPTNVDNDLANDNVDIDNDNDGITNCTESFGNLNLNLSNLNSGTISIGNYTSTFVGSQANSSKTSTSPFIGAADGSFISDIPSGKINYVSYLMSFAKPISIGMEYITTANATDLLNADAEYIINSDIDKTITVLNPTDQLLIDTNYDGIYESGITEFSSFEIRFRLKSALPLAAGTGNFKFLTYLTNSIRFTHKNLSDDIPNKSSFRLFAVCVPKDSDADGVPDQLDYDSDNDGIPDVIEAQGSNSIAYSSVDINKDGLSDVFGTGIIPVDTDSDFAIGGAPDYLDLDSDNDGIFDLTESGFTVPDSNNNGIIDGLPAVFGTNGLYNNIETTADSGILKNAVADTDSDGKANYIELDSDNDSCYDVVEAGFTDNNNDGIVGNSPLTVNAFGIVTSRTDGYTTPNSNYITSAPITITEQPINQAECNLQAASFTVQTNSVSGYQWQVSTDGNLWINITNNVLYSGANSAKLTINSITNAMNATSYRVYLSKTGNSCGLYSNPATLTVYALPNNTTPIELKQCDDDLDGFSTFNITEQNNLISSNYLNETFTYYTTFNGANSKDPSVKIDNPLSYRSKNNSIWARIENANNCYSITQLNLIVSSTQIPSTFSRRFENCDDYVDASQNDVDGIATFDFSSTTTDIKALLPSTNNLYVIKYYGNEADALSEINEITNTTNYRNETSPNFQEIWVRVESTLDNSCYGLGPHVKLRVNPKPNINTNEDNSDDTLICSNLPTFFVQLNAGLIDGSPTKNYTYIWSKDNQVLPGKSSYTLDVNSMGKYSVTVTNASGCNRTRTINVTASDIAHIDKIDIVDLAINNTVTIIVSGQGKYEYSLDAEFGPFQSSNFFENIPAGIHEIFVKDINGCGTIQQTIAIIGVPKFFTPNGDGFNDYWNLKGVNTNLNSKSIIYIFNRYGKLLKELNPNSNGWDGKFNGQPLPADDYWYTIKLEDGRELKGHFSIKR